MLKINDKAPNFVLLDKNGQSYSLEDFPDYLIIFFYPKDNTPGCTIEAKNFSDKLKDFKKIKCDVIGISGGDARSKSKFCEKNKLKTVLLSDPDFTIAKKYGAYGQKQFMGRKFLGIKRMTFVIKNKKIAHIFDSVKPADHVAEVIELIKNIK